MSSVLARCTWGAAAVDGQRTDVLILPAGYTPKSVYQGVKAVAHATGLSVSWDKAVKGLVFGRPGGAQVIAAWLAAYPAPEGTAPVSAPPAARKASTRKAADAPVSAPPAVAPVLSPKMEAAVQVAQDTARQALAAGTPGADVAVPVAVSFTLPKWEKGHESYGDQHRAVRSHLWRAGITATLLPTPGNRREFTVNFMPSDTATVETVTRTVRGAVTLAETVAA